jgi:hypothetical protein
MMKTFLLMFLLLFFSKACFSWGFFGHQRINRYAIFLLPPEMLVLYKPHSDFLIEHSVDPDRRRYLLPQEGARHYIDIDQYGKAPYDPLPRKWKDAVAKFGEDTLQSHGIVPWWIQVMLERLTKAFKEKNQPAILKLSAEIGHYIADAHVPLHACHNHNGQYSGQHGIHGLWESRIPELLADKEWDFFIRPAAYIPDPGNFIWARVLESAAAADTVLSSEKALTIDFPGDKKFAFEARNDVITRQYATGFVIAYDKKMKGMVERRMRQSIFATASFWYTAWVNAGQPDLKQLLNDPITIDEEAGIDSLNTAWKNARQVIKSCD